MRAIVFSVAFLSAVLCGELACRAQNPAFGWRPGLEIGGNLVWLKYDQPLSIWTTDSRFDFSGGMTVQVPVSPISSFVLGFRIVGLGNQVEFDNRRDPIQFPLEVSGTFETQQNYVTFPCYIKIHTAKQVGPFVEIGPEYGILLSATQRYVDIDPPEARQLVSSTSRITSDLERSNLTAGGGVGLEFPLGAQKLEISLRLSIGLMGVAKPDKWLTNWQTREARLVVCYRL